MLGAKKYSPPNSFTKFAIVNFLPLPPGHS